MKTKKPTKKAQYGSITEKLQIAAITAELQKTVIKREASPDPLNDQVDGRHYQKLGLYQPWVVMAKWMSPEELKGYMKGTVCAYLCREDDKGGRRDIEKAAHTMQIYLEVSK